MSKSSKTLVIGIIVGMVAYYAYQAMQANKPQASKAS